MTLQNKVYEKQAIGVVGEFADSSPKRVAPYVVNANSSIPPSIGCAYTVDATTGVVTIGGEGTFIGIAVGPKQFAALSMSPSLVLADGATAEICSMGHIFVTTKTAAKPNFIAAFDPANGQIYAYATAAVATNANHTVIPGAKFALVDADANATAILELNP